MTGLGESQQAQAEADRWSQRVRPESSRTPGDVYHVLAIGSPKELGHGVADALLNPATPAGQRIRS